MGACEINSVAMIRACEFEFIFEPWTLWQTGEARFACDKRHERSSQTARTHARPHTLLYSIDR